MKTKTTLLVIVTTLLLTGCMTWTEVGSTRSKTERVPLNESVTAVAVDIDIGAGKLTIGDDSTDDLMAGEFTYNVAEWEPVVSYDDAAGQGRLSIATPEQSILKSSAPDVNVRSEWDLVFNKETPLDMDVTVGVGDANLDFSGLTLTDLDVETGVGKTVIDLSGDWVQSVDASIRGGMGPVTVLLPKDVGVRAQGEVDLGAFRAAGMRQQGDAYVNAAYESSPVTIDLNVIGGVGNITLELVD